MFERLTEFRNQPIRKIAIVALLVFSVGGAAIAVLCSWVLPGLVVDRVQVALRERFGLEARISRASVGWSGCELGPIGVAFPETGSSRFEIPKVIVRANLIGLILFKVRAIDAVELDAFKGSVNISDPHIKAWLHRINLSKSGETATKEKNTSIQLIFNNYNITIYDLYGKLLHLNGSYTAYQAGKAVAVLPSVSIGSLPGSAIELSGVEIEFERENKENKLKRLEIADARVELGEKTQKNGDGVTNEEKVKKSIKRYRPQPPRGDEEGGKTDKTAIYESVDTFQRVRVLAAALRAEAPRASSKVRQGTSDNTGILATLSRVLSDKLVLSLRNATISDGSQQNGKVVMRGLRGGVRASAGGAYDLEAQGRGQAGGALGCKIRIWPRQLKAEGHLALRSLPFALVTPFLPDAPWYEPEAASIDGELDLVAESIDRLAITGCVHVRNVSLASERIAPVPVRDIEVGAAGKGRWYPNEKRLEIAEAKVALNDAQLKLSGAAEVTSDHYLIDLSIKLPALPCNQAVGAIPRDLLGDLASFDWRGTFGGEVKAQIDSRDLDKAQLNIVTQDKCVFLNVPALADLRPFRLPFVHQVIEPDGSLFEMETGPGTPNWSYLEEISPFVVYAVMAHEDAGFISHHGFSVRHIRDALVRDLKEGRYAVGASTITMQLVKNLLLRREKTLARKVQEVLLTWWVERVLEKREILELYLNIIEYGPGIYGIRNAAKYYFGRTPADLSPAEAVYLSTILPNPKRYHSFFERRSVPPVWLDLMRPILRRLGDKGWISAEAMEYGVAELSNFRFYGEGEAAPSRQVPAATNPFADGHLSDAERTRIGAIIDNDTIPSDDDSAAYDSLIISEKQPSVSQ